jgi:hypothetical protein
MSESDHKAPERAASSPVSEPDDLVKDLEIEVSDEDKNNVKGGMSDPFADLGDIKGSVSRR